MRDDSYVVILPWMVTELKLKGNTLIVYAIIHGFSMAGRVFDGSLQYLADWTNSTKQGVLKSLKMLMDEGLITKQEKVTNGVKFCEYKSEYHSTKFNGGIKQSLMGGIKQSLTNNKDIDNKDNNKDKYIAEVTEIIDYLNTQTGKRYRAESAQSKHIRARLSEGYTVEDCKRVIDIKVKEWLGNDMEKYLRPETLFNATKFENYINQGTKKPRKDIGKVWE